MNYMFNLCLNLQIYTWTCKLTSNILQSLIHIYHTALMGHDKTSIKHTLPHVTRDWERTVCYTPPRCRMMTVLHTSCDSGLRAYCMLHSPTMSYDDCVTYLMWLGIESVLYVTLPHDVVWWLCYVPHVTRDWERTVCYTPPRCRMMTVLRTSCDSGLRAYCMLHSPTMPRCRMTLMAVLRSMLYSTLVRVWLGATTIDSPVWIPRGSTFSMLHTWSNYHIFTWVIALFNF